MSPKNRYNPTISSPMESEFGDDLMMRSYDRETRMGDENRTVGSGTGTGQNGQGVDGRESSYIPDYYYQPRLEIQQPRPISHSHNHTLSQHSFINIPSRPGNGDLHPSPSIESFLQEQEQDVGNNYVEPELGNADTTGEKRYSELYAAATGRSDQLKHQSAGLGLGLGLESAGEKFPLPPSRSSPSHSPSSSQPQPESPFQEKDLLTVNEPRGILKRTAHRAGTPVIPLDGRFQGSQPAPAPGFLGTDPFADPSRPSFGGGSEASGGTPRPSFSSARTTGTTRSRNTQAAQIERLKMVEKQKRQRKRRWIVIALVLALVILAMVIPVAYVMSKKNKDDPQPTGRTRGSGAGRNTTQTDELRLKQYSNTSSALNPMGLLFTPTRGVQEGANGSTVYTYVDGVETNFTYVNEFGGDFSWDPSLGIMGKGGKAQSWSPRVGEEWDWNTDLVRGVNLGGWLVTEPFIVPHLYQGAYAGALDEKELSAMMRNKSNTTLELVMREHYETFITEQDFAQIAQAGLNYVRIPLGFWAVEKLPEEPFLESVSWEYFVRSLHWARKYGIRVILDLHALPGAQTPWNHAMGAKGVVNWLYGVAGILNAQRTLETVRSLTQFISQDGYKDVVTMISLVNEVEASRQGFNTLLSFYYTAYNMIRQITGLGKGPIVLVHEGFQGIAAFNHFMPGADRVAIDQHPYRAFIDPAEMDIGWDAQNKVVCGWGGGTNESRNEYGIIIGGEFSAAINNCGYWLNGVGAPVTYESTGKTCATWNDWTSWSPELKTNISRFTLYQMDALQNFAFWTWKITGSDATIGIPSSPFWHYKLGWEQGWIPKDPRAAAGMCASIGVGGAQFSGNHPASATGGGNGALETASMTNYTAWPPTALGPSPTFQPDQIALFPTYTQTGTPVTLPQPTQSSGVPVGNGWANSEDKTGAWVAVAGCPYPDAYNATASSLIPTALCTGSNKKRAEEQALTLKPTPIQTPGLN